jgi:hypothetical protein
LSDARSEDWTETGADTGGVAMTDAGMGVVSGGTTFFGTVVVVFGVEEVVVVFAICSGVG